MGDFNFRIGKRQVQKPHIIYILKFWNPRNCNYAEKRSSKGKRCKTEANKHMDIYETNNFWNSKWEIWNWYKREIYFINNTEVGWWNMHCWRKYK